MKALITLGPTQEPIDEVRYITTGSSGKMGAALAAEGVKRGHEITLIAGPVGIPLPDGAKVLSVTTAKEMLAAVLKELGKGYDVFICSAAVADYSPMKRKGKIRSDNESLIIELKRNPKITATVKKKFPQVLVVAFKAEYRVSENELFRRALNKLKKEGLDMICANDISKSPLGGDYNEMILIGKKGKKEKSPKNTKQRIAGQIWDMIEKEIISSLPD